MTQTYAKVRRHPWLLLPLALLGFAVFVLVASSIFAADQTLNNSVELDGNIANDAAAGTDWGPGSAGAGICKATGTLGTDGNGYIAANSPSAPIQVSTCDGDSYLTTTNVVTGGTKSFGADKTYFSSNKDIQDIGTPISGVSGVWGCTEVNNPTPKDEILNAYAALATITDGGHPGDTGLFVGFERGTNNGTSFQGVWFLQNALGCTAPATGSANFTCTGAPAGQGCHTAWTFDTSTTPWTVTHTGDILLLINFSGGGNDTTAAMYAWAPAYATRAQDAYPLLLLDGLNGVPFQALGSDCQDPAKVSGATGICATTNNPNIFTTPGPNDTSGEGCIVTAWPPANQTSCVTGASGKTTDTGGTPILDKLQFFEGMVNLTDVFGTVPCFSQALFEARTSDVPTATLKDYTIGPFNTCGKIIIHKETDPEDADHTFGYTTTGGNGLPASFSLEDDGNNELGCDYSNATPSTADDCGALGTKVFNDITPGDYSVTENDPSSDTPPFDFQNLTCNVVSGDASVNITDRTADIHVGILGVVECLYENRQRGSIIVRKEDEDGNLLPGAGYTFDVNPFTGVTGDTEILDGGAEDQFNGDDGLLCIDNVVFGTYNLTETTVPPGYFGDPSKQTVTVDSPSSCADRTTSDTPDATFVNKLGAIVIRKEAKNANTTDQHDLLAGAGFTFDVNPFDGGAAIEIDDGGAQDKAATGGIICIDHVLKGTYHLTETQVPANYAGDDSDIAVTVDAAGNCTDRLAADPVVYDATFVNVPLSQIEVKFDSLAGAGVTKSNIVCVDASSTPVPPNTENGNPDPAFDDTDEVYGNGTSGLLPGTYTCTVVIDP